MTHNSKADVISYNLGCNYTCAELFKNRLEKQPGWFFFQDTEKLAKLDISQHSMNSKGETPRQSIDSVPAFNLLDS